MRQTRTDYRSPYRPWPIALANRVLPRARAMTSERLLASAARRAGSSDFGADDFREPLAKLLEAVASEARLSRVGHFVTRERLIGVLANRARAVRAERTLEVKAVSPPIVITGLQRTGTTLLHRLLAADPKHRVLASWEALHPVPIRDVRDGQTDPRIRAAERAERALRYLAPDFFAVHPVQAHAPEEEVVLLDQSFRSTVAEATLRVPSFARWLEAQDQRPAYETLARLLGLLSAQRGAGKRWVLKTPHHLEWLDVLFEVFPGTRVIWTHRDPVVTLASFCSMVAHGRGVFSDEVDPIEIGAEWSRKVARMVDRALAARASRESSFIDVHYEALVADPMREVRRIYQELGEALSVEAAERMSQTLSDHGQYRFGRHVYRLEDFGLSVDQVADKFVGYRARFV